MAVLAVVICYFSSAAIFFCCFITSSLYFSKLRSSSVWSKCIQQQYPQHNRFNPQEDLKHTYKILSFLCESSLHRNSYLAKIGSQMLLLLLLLIFFSFLSIFNLFIFSFSGGNTDSPFVLRYPYVCLPYPCYSKTYCCCCCYCCVVSIGIKGTFFFYPSPNTNPIIGSSVSVMELVSNSTMLLTFLRYPLVTN